MTIQHDNPQGRFEAVMAALLRKTLQLLLKPVFNPRFSIAFQRRWLGWMSALTLPPRSVAIEPGQAGGVPGEWLRPRESGPHGAAMRGGTLLYLHGGAYCVGSPATHRAITGRLARLTGMAVFSLDYRLAPEHRFPAAVDDAVAACLDLQARGPVVIAGDSAGGGLALATALALRDGGHATPAALWLLSPWADMAMPATAPPPVPGEAMLSFDWASACARHCLGDTPPSHPLASPLHADLRGLPPVLVQAGTDEMLHGQALALHDALERVGVAVRCEVTARRWHVFQMNGGALPSADAALQRAGDFIGEQVDAASAVTPAVLQHEVLILGAGMSGLCMAVQLKRAGTHDFVILEKSAGLGGTWWDNRYPGAHVDVPSPLYSFSFAPNPRWRRRFAASAEIQAYMLGVARRFGVLPHVRFGRQVQSAVFDEAAGRWTITTAGGQQHSARFFVCSTGPLNQPRLPDIAGLAGFQGRVLHSARWDPSVDLAGQRVAVIGTGSTASQLVAPIAGQAGQLHVFQRTANWVLPRIDRRYFAVDGWLARLPPYAVVVRAFWFHVLEWGRRGFEEGTVARRGMLKTAALHRARQVKDTALRERLTPSYPLGCKRIIYSNDFYPAFSRPNVELVTTPIERFTAHGIVTADGQQRPIDTLVCATGFDTVQLLNSVAIVGRDGRRLNEAWRDGPEAWHGLVVAGFPNFFLMLGPNTATGHTSTLLFIEPGVSYAIACMQHLRASGARWLDLRAEVMVEHNRMLQARLAGSVWTACRSWYRTDSGKVVALWPGFTAEYQKAIARPDFANYTRA
jgi:cation diffusion facilitator CzcD-associated flavoprotein CzcO/acetyl esterase/lipase